MLQSNWGIIPRVAPLPYAVAFHSNIKIVHIAMLFNASILNSYRPPFPLIMTLQITKPQAIFFMKSFTVTDELSVVQQLQHTAH